MSKYLLSAAVIALAGAAHAQEAFITQIGDGNDAVNIAQRGFGQGNTQVIAQEGDDLSAANLTRGRDNQAFTYQSFTSGYTGFGGATASGTSLIWQTGTDSFNGGENNIAVTVQLHDTNNAPDYVSQTIQAGDDNVALNWTEDGGSDVPLFTGSLDAPKLSLTAKTAKAPTPGLLTNFRPGARVAVR